ncbi:mineralocorticoid receptor, variant 3 [Dermatophagoides farinae]|uniref:Mineralocorticoid receptor, variant 3 n=1 Tax=Dermatophagoides farinae TaxID=6954 RepID=A0A922I0J4_DERFA|nr:mineralocorticoid receptor, variant 3 [Dermatophagoides farinae]
MTAISLFHIDSSLVPPSQTQLSSRSSILHFDGISINNDIRANIQDVCSSAPASSSPQPQPLSSFASMTGNVIL